MSERTIFGKLLLLIHESMNHIRRDWMAVLDVDYSMYAMSSDLFALFVMTLYV